MIFLISFIGFSTDLGKRLQTHTHPSEYALMCTHMLIHTHIYTLMHVHMHICIYLHTCTCIYTHSCIFIYMYNALTCTDIREHNTLTYMYTYARTCVHMQTHVCRQIHIQIYTFNCTHIHMNTYLLAFTHTCLYAHIYTCICIQTQTQLRQLCLSGIWSLPYRKTTVMPFFDLQPQFPHL